MSSFTTVASLLIALASTAQAGFIPDAPIKPDMNVVYKDAIEKAIRKSTEVPAWTSLVAYDDDEYSAFPSSLPSPTRTEEDVVSPDIKKKSVPSGLYGARLSRVMRARPHFEDKVSDKNNIVDNIKASFATPSPTTRLVQRKVFGLDDDNVAEYWFNNRIHTFGNTGPFGAVHAFLAPVATKIIDRAAYSDIDIRTEISKYLRVVVNKSRARVLDMCSGVGISTRALQDAFSDAEIVCGIDTSPEMIYMARALTRLEYAVNRLSSRMRASWDRAVHGTSKLERRNPVAQFARVNAERTNLPGQSFDLVTIMYAFHEAPKYGRYLMLREVRRLLKHGGTLAVVDISPEYTPSDTMLAGEPYVLEYQKDIMKQMQGVAGFSKSEYQVIVPGHVGLWLLTRDVKPRLAPKMSS
mmetsp:Transcript_16932/g.26417  ORF Transcript_16932/g.26417 Transcript_16932/m.26417 type:complete len:410 (-) Transcript_16932:316-1545(-)|eukprot:CAMPEP_0196826932 /NCGR_PEP_ID=MMETSP1362-20130617/93887_1 /TAXON_ID=163516 /ORGANISM="Leptocylindrus danicus, Strain CCMP1856" /LENGTH=409 /DNA_ID=CAMNT_0042207531 /DNA_START=676 /DNA_END=1905 /DNA_ORIENTATION=+